MDSGYSEESVYSRYSADKGRPQSLLVTPVSASHLTKFFHIHIPSKSQAVTREAIFNTLDKFI